MVFDSLFGKAPQPLPDGVAVLSTDSAKKAIDNGEFRLLVDVRSEEEWNRGHLPGAVHAPVTDINNHLDKLERHKHDKILLYCRTQARSGNVARILHDKGFTRVSVMEDGSGGWEEKGYSQASVAVPKTALAVVTPPVNSP